MTDELEIFKSLKDIRIVFDVGARISDNRKISCDITDYLKIKPKAKYHLFEPYPRFFEELEFQVGHLDNVILNNYGLGDIEKEQQYNEISQSFTDSLAIFNNTLKKNPVLPIKTLDWYVKENEIKRIDFLKIDTEGYDLKVLQGGKKAIKITRYIQFEHWDNQADFRRLLDTDFSFEDIGYRNILCKRL